MLHGYMSCKESFYYQIKFLSRFFRVTAPDIIGFGASAPPDRAFSLEDYRLWLTDFIATARLEKPHIIAHSFGARMALKLLSADADAADRLVITGGAGLVKPRSKKYLRRVAAYRRVKKIFPKFAERHFGSREYRALPPQMRESYKKIVNEDLKSCAAHIKNRTLLVYGSADTVTPAKEEGRTFHSLIAGSRLTVMDGGHFCFSEYGEKFNEIVYSFLTEN